MKYRLKIIIALTMAMIVNGVLAQTTTAVGNMTTNAVLQSSCILSTESIFFGTINPLSYSGTSAGSITATCSKGITYSIFPTNGYGYATQANSLHIMKSIDQSNKDCLLVQLSPTVGAIWSSYTARNITGTGTGSSVVHGIKALFNPNLISTSYDATCTNSNNSEAAPGNYAATVMVQVNY